jgi:hypothetical protein
MKGSIPIPESASKPSSMTNYRTQSKSAPEDLKNVFSI